MIGSKSGKWALCLACSIYCELEADGSCSECGHHDKSIVISQL
jgi:hypothetical protein